MFKKPLLIAGLTVAIAGGGIAFQSAQFPITGAHASTHLKSDQVDKSDGDGEVADSKEMKGEKAEGENEVSDAKEQQQLQKSAKVSKDAAVKAALSKVKGTVVQVELENENGHANYNVAIKNNNSVKEVKVDATDGSVLKVESGDNDKGEKETEDK